MGIFLIVLAPIQFIVVWKYLGFITLGGSSITLALGVYLITKGKKEE